MMPGLLDDHPSIRYYDSDYPGVETSPVAENVDSVLAYQGLALDVERYKQLAAQAAGPVLELGCGTGRVLIPLARAGHDVTGVDISAAMIAQLADRLAAEPAEVRQRVRYVTDDIRNLALDESFALIIYPFNGLLCIPDFAGQRRALSRAAAHLKIGGRVVLDLVNPLVLPLGGNDAPKPFFTRRHHKSGNQYTRFAAMSALRADQTQDLFGWYDELDERGFVCRTPYRMTWRPVFRYEIELMVEAAGLTLERVEGDHQGAAFGDQSERIFLIATKFHACEGETGKWDPSVG